MTKIEQRFDKIERKLGCKKMVPMHIVWIKPDDKDDKEKGGKDDKEQTGKD